MTVLLGAPLLRRATTPEHRRPAPARRRQPPTARSSYGRRRAQDVCVSEYAKMSADAKARFKLITTLDDLGDEKEDYMSGSESESEGESESEDEDEEEEKEKEKEEEDGVVQPAATRNRRW